ncbi:unnamed protein product [Spirodela intermedia]|uniref:Uncharacterized protein n=1 Tax=Spirodela intermedia TaxID=51605 RepID=A0A7I8KTT1_SPIIN|nr:unnamed protein product [Spirodela intermedia]
MRMALRLTRSYCVPIEERIEAITESSTFIPSFRLRQYLSMTSSKRLSFFDRLLYGSFVPRYLPEQNTEHNGHGRRGYGFGEIDSSEGRYHHHSDEAELDAHDGPVRRRQFPEGLMGWRRPEAFSTADLGRLLPQQRESEETPLIVG